MTSPPVVASVNAALPAARRDTAARLVWLAVGAWLAVQWWLVVDLPLLADDHVLLANAARFDQWWDVLANNPMPPPRPLQHLMFWFGTACGDAAPAVMRTFVFVLHGFAVALVAASARQQGLGPRAAALAAAAFAAFPAGRGLYWPAAVGGSARVAATLLALHCFQRGGRASAVVATAAMAAGLGFHQAVLLVPAFCLLRAVTAADGPRDVAARALAVVRRPAFAAMLALAVAGVAWFTATPDPYLNRRALGSIAANATWAAAWPWPELLRVAAVDSVRGVHGEIARWLGGAALLGFLGLALALLRRGGAMLRFALLAGATDLLLPVLTAGWSLRYALLAAAFLAVPIATLGSRRGGAVLYTLLLCAWLADSVHTLVEFRAATALSRELVQEAAATRTALPAAQPLYVLDPPDVFGRERDIALANWGVAEAVAARGVPGELRLLRTRPHKTSSAAQPIDAARADALRREAAVLEYDAAERHFRFWLRGQRQPIAGR